MKYDVALDAETLRKVLKSHDENGSWISLELDLEKIDGRYERLMEKVFWHLKENYRKLHDYCSP